MTAVQATDLPFPDALPNERWRPAPGFPAYAVSTANRWRRRYTSRDGWTAPRTTATALLRQRTGYAQRRVSRLVALAFAEEQRPARSPRAIVGKLADHLDQLGKVPDQAIADAAGVTRARVQQVRRRLDIAAAPTETHLCKLAAADRRADLSLARDRLGTVPDPVLAAEFGVSRSLIQTIRLEMGIAAYPHRKRATRLSPFVHLLGAVTDSEIARRAGCTVANVTNFRNRRGIAPFRKRAA